ncbi:hypothetical protein BB561_001855 [Smittium simulii]|uniref:Uncharacterized protein n=1 Tax=Smittium simulii TaxID=133385 RepID=A0A2T9YSR4_9FUNG|nr:hypothetical protein BB561_001855 [Smittium simulii]
MSNVPGVIQSAAAGVPLIPTKRTRLEYSTVAKTAPKNAMETKINNLFVDINKNINQKAQKKFKEPEEHTIKLMQKKINNFFGKSKKNNTTFFSSKAQKQPTYQEQLAENSNRLGELQKLATEQKSDYKNSKEKAGQCIISNTHKTPVEISLELPDQAIVSESSCPSTPNFKKEWNKSDENYTGNNVSVALIDIILSMS